MTFSAAKGYISPSASRSPADVRPLTEPCLGIVSVCSLPFRQAEDDVSHMQKASPFPRPGPDMKGKHQQRKKAAQLCSLV